MLSVDLAGSKAGRAVLVAGGAGAGGNAAIQLARWAGADVTATVSGEAKARLATAGAHHGLCLASGKVVPQCSKCSNTQATMGGSGRHTADCH